MPPLQPRDDMVLHDVHFGEDGGIGKSTSIILKKTDVLFCEYLCVGYKNVELTLMIHFLAC